MDARPVGPRRIRIGDTVIRRGRPPGSTKTQVSLHLDNDVIAAFRAQGAGWQSDERGLWKAAGVVGVGYQHIAPRWCAY